MRAEGFRDHLGQVIVIAAACQEEVPRRISEEGLGAFLSKAYCFLVAEATTLLLCMFQSQRKVTLQLPWSI